MPPPQLEGSFVEYPGPGRQYMVGRGLCTCCIDVRESGTSVGTVQVQHDFAGAPFRSIVSFGDWLAIGLSDVAVLVNRRFSNSWLYPLDGYFGSFYLVYDKLLVCSASQVVALGLLGQEMWRTEGLGLDGVIIHQHDETSVSGTGEMDPPGGWLPFVLDHRTGRRLA